MNPSATNKKILCSCRNLYVQHTPEEKVRQSFLRKLYDGNPIQKKYTEVEVHTANGLADLVIYDENRSPLMVIEFKSKSVILSSQVVDQVMGYNEMLGAPFTAISNGNDTFIYHVIEGKAYKIKEKCIIKFLQEKNIQYAEPYTAERLIYEDNIFDFNLCSLISKAIISEETAASKQPFFAELRNALMAEKYIPSGRDLPIKDVIDCGIDFSSFSNAAGGVWAGLHRNFQVHVKYKGVFMFCIAIMASAATVNDKTFGNRNGATSLNIAMIKKRPSTYNLQLNLDNYTKFSKDGCTIWHDGKKSRTKMTKVKDAVSKFAPFLMDGDYIIIADLPDGRSISPEEFSIFIENLITYSVARNRVR